ncbi:MAG: hypothetical protein WCJ01_08405 [Ignavibacteria bacterium]
MLPGIIPWDEPAGIYRKMMHKSQGQIRQKSRVGSKVNISLINGIQNMRSGTEGKSGQSKNFYDLNQTSARLEQTSISRHINEIILFQWTLNNFAYVNIQFFCQLKAVSILLVTK